jgi:two-component system C4-dicarboxylate transport sensor histidine kinase DctB
VQVLVNLLTNGLHAAQNRSPAAVTLRTEQLAGEVLVHVEDTGAGIDPENIDQIFEPFFTTREAGLGLGLSISRKIIESMNGRIEVCNLPAGGARFSIRLPREDA